MTKLEQAARQALEVLKNQSPDRDMVRAAFALQEALAEQAEQEPVGWYKPSDFVLYRTKPDDVFVYAPLYASPVRTKDLTDDEISDAIHGEGSPLRLHDYAIRDFRAVIAADREKNK